MENDVLELEEGADYAISKDDLLLAVGKLKQYCDNKLLELSAELHGMREHFDNQILRVLEELAKPRTVTKRVSYNSSGLPEEITESEHKDSAL